MYNECSYEWDCLADVWDLFEEKGFNVALVADEVGVLRTPLAIVGCGNGSVLAHLQQRLGAEAVWGFDASAPMVRRAAERGCRNVHHVDPADPIPIGTRFATILIATGVMDLLELPEAAALLAQLRTRLAHDGELRIYAFARYGRNWEVARTLGATCTLGISNRVLFDLYAAAAARSVDNLIAEQLELTGRAALQARIWLQGIDRFVSKVATSRACSRDDAIEFVRRITPQVQRRFDDAELLAAAAQAGLTATSVEHYERDGVLQLVCRASSTTGVFSEELSL